MTLAPVQSSGVPAGAGLCSGTILGVGMDGLKGCPGDHADHRFGDGDGARLRRGESGMECVWISTVLEWGTQGGGQDVLTVPLIW